MSQKVLSISYVKINQAYGASLRALPHYDKVDFGHTASVRR